MAYIKMIFKLVITKNLNLTIMNVRPTLKIVHRLMIEKPHLDPAFDDTELHAGGPIAFIDAYDYYPDFGI